MLSTEQPKPTMPPAVRGIIRAVESKRDNQASVGQKSIFDLVNGQVKQIKAIHDAELLEQRQPKSLVVKLINGALGMISKNSDIIKEDGVKANELIEDLRNLVNDSLASSLNAHCNSMQSAAAAIFAVHGAL